MYGRCLHGPHWPEQAGMGRSPQPCPFKAVRLLAILRLGRFVGLGMQPVAGGHLSPPPGCLDDGVESGSSMRSRKIPALRNRSPGHDDQRNDSDQEHRQQEQPADQRAWAFGHGVVKLIA